MQVPSKAEEPTVSLLDKRIEDLDFTRNIREKLVLKNLVNGGIPDDLEAQKMILQTVREIDNAVGVVAKIENDKAKIAIDASNAKSQQKFIDNMVQILHSDIGLKDVTGEVLELPKELAVLTDQVPGELDTDNVPQLEVSDFT